MTSETLDATLQRLAAGRSAWKDPCRVASSSNLTLSGEQTVDSVACVAGDRVLVAGQSSSVQNGIYVVATAAWTRAADMAKSAHVRHGMVTTVIDGNTNAGIWQLTSPTSGTITIGQTALSISKVIADDSASRISALETPPQTVHTADGALVFGRVNILTSVADGMTIPDVATNAGEYMWVVNAMAATTATLTRSGSDVVVNGTSGTAYSLPAGETVILRAGATGTNVYVEHGGSGGAASGTEAPTVSTIPQRTSAGIIRAVGYTAETNTDADRYVRGTTTDGTTLDIMRVEGAGIALGRKSADAYNRLDVTPAADASALLVQSLSSADAVNPLTLKATTYKVNVTSRKIGDASDAYGQTYTPAAAATLVYGNDITSLTDRITQASSGAGKTRNLFGGLGASGSANGAFYFGLENGNTVTGGSVNACLGSLVSNASDPFIFGVGTPGSLTNILDVFQLSAGLTRIRSLNNALNVFAVGALSLSSNVDISLSSAADITVSADVWYRKSVAGTYIYREPVGSFGPIASATTTTVFSYTTITARIYDVVATVVVTNDTDNEGAAYYLRASFKNIAGTVTQIGATQAIAADLEDAGQTGLSCTIDFSGTAIRVRLTTDAGDTVNGSYVVKITERVQA